jgi:quinolinate synthase
VAVVNSLKENELLMTPDRNLAQYTASRTGKKIHLWDGFCPIHNNLTAEQVLIAKKAHPDAVFMAHPECRPEVLKLADVILSTSGMIRHAAESDRRIFIVGTEVGMLYPIRKASPGKTFYPASEAMVCQDMKRISLEDIVRSLETMHGEVRVPEEIRVPALSAVRRMIELPQ